MSGAQLVAWAGSDDVESLVWVLATPRSWARMSSRYFAPDDPFDVADVVAVAEGVAAEIFGAPWPVVARLSAGAAAAWHVFEGWCLTGCGGFDPLADGVSAARIVGALVALHDAGHKDDQERALGRAKLRAPLDRSPKAVSD
ncbi:hypothetical protein [Streptomyces alboflavus]|uniref:hypothetical protein n=1 Tax=Streptomyces alboflavus TaxID=67267 RepID=UPI0036781AC9